MKACLSRDRAFVELRGQRWSDRWPVAALPGWLRFYRGLRDRARGQYADHYAETVCELERVARELEADPPWPGGGGGQAVRAA